MPADLANLIRDVAASSVDTRPQVLIRRAMERMMVGRARLVIAHRLSTICDAGLRLVMHDDTVIEKGTLPAARFLRRPVVQPVRRGES